MDFKLFLSRRQIELPCIGLTGYVRRRRIECDRLRAIDCDGKESVFKSKRGFSQKDPHADKRGVGMKTESDSRRA